ncbi:MAG: class I SAM-dependent RNA methyltransferase [Planctomycetota bacterium]
MTELRVGTLLELDIERLAYGGDGIARAGAQVVFVPFTAPGERVRARVTELHARFARAEVESVTTASDARRVARCTHFGACGGCQLQHLTQPAQLDVKVGFLHDALVRIGRLEVEVDVEVVSGPEWSYRSRVELAVERHGEHVDVGLLRRGSSALVPIGMCPIAKPDVESAIAGVRASAPELPAGVESIVIESAPEDVLVTTFPAQARSEAPRVNERVVAGFTLRSDARTFFQANDALASELVRVAVDGVDGALALDLFAGVGLFTLPLARRVDALVAVEENPVAVAFGRENTRRSALSNVRWRTSRVDRWLARSAAELSAVDFVLLDPPRAGAGASTVRAIAALAPREVRYVSCDPTTLARDLALFVGAGFRITRIVLVDMFPQTTHVESVVTLRRDAAQR